MNSKLTEIVARMRQYAGMSSGGVAPAIREWADDIEAAATSPAPTLTPAEERFFQAARDFCELWTRDHRNNFKDGIASGLDNSRARLYAAYRALSPGVMETKEGKP